VLSQAAISELERSPALTNAKETSFNDISIAVVVGFAGDVDGVPVIPTAEGVWLGADDSVCDGIRDGSVVGSVPVGPALGVNEGVPVVGVAVGAFVKTTNDGVPNGVWTLPNVVGKLAFSMAA
jgi:hypothetical protein